MPASPTDAGAAALADGADVAPSPYLPAADSADGGAPGAGTARREARSLFGEILDWMFAPLLLLWPMSVSLTYLVAQSIASSPYDRALVERGEALAAHVRIEQGHARFDSTAGLLEIFGNGVGEAGTYLIVERGGRVLAGDADLPHAHELQLGGAAGAGGLDETFHLRDDRLRGHPVRVAYAWVGAAGAGDGATALVEVAESPADRTQLANEIVKGVILPQFVVLPLALVLVWFGLSRGLAPLARLQQTIRNRPPDDLSPINAESAPEELTPLLASFNELLGRMTHNLQVQKRFIADAAHQMKTPLAGLRTQAELAQREGDAQELQRSLRQIAASTERATRLINQLLALARAEHGAAERGQRVAVDLDRLARDVVQDWVGTALAQQIDLGYEGPDAALPAGTCGILGAPTLLRELLNNLLDNALRYTAGHAARLRACGLRDALAPAPRVTVRVHGAAGLVVLEVEDAGPGIAPEERAQVFERFYRVLGTQQDGSGLGLAIVREIATQHHARLELLDVGAGADPVLARGKPPPESGPGALFRVSFASAPPTAADLHESGSAGYSH